MHYFSYKNLPGGGIMFAAIAMVGLILSYIGWYINDRFHQHIHLS